MKKLLLTLLLLTRIAFAQHSYIDSINGFISDYVAKHEVVTGADKQHLHFFELKAANKVIARFERVDNSRWFKMQATGSFQPLYRVYGKVHFTWRDTAASLTVYQSQNLMQTEKYKDDLFIPFTDATSGNSTYEGGRYIDFTIKDIKNGILPIDFNKAYNPYCAYVSDRYSCPIPPKENQLSVAITAGEQKYSKAH